MDDLDVAVVLKPFMIPGHKYHHAILDEQIPVPALHSISVLKIYYIMILKITYYVDITVTEWNP